MFLDEAVVEVSSGQGGKGEATFHREKHVPRGGPNGADGGKGGSVIFVADHSKRTLIDFRLNPLIKAQSGADARGNKRGKDGQDTIVHVPEGTTITDEETGTLLADLSAHGQTAVVCKGGRGGRGNSHFVSSTNQAPRIAELGEPSKTQRLRLELKLLADIGLIGLPNAGKSTLLSRISAARPKVADYPFTTIEPNLGVVRTEDSEFVVADLPGLIEGASAGKGLGHRFLRHAERTAALAHVVEVLPLDESEPAVNYDLVENELREYSPELHAKPRLIVLNKIDLLSEGAVEELARALAGRNGEVFPISAVTGKGIETLLYAMAGCVEAERASQPAKAKTMIPAPEPDAAWSVEQNNGGFRITGERIQSMVAMTDFESHDALRFLHRRLERAGVIQRLRDLGAKEGDTVVIGDYELEFSERG